MNIGRGANMKLATDGEKRRADERGMSLTLFVIDGHDLENSVSFWGRMHFRPYVGDKIVTQNGIECSVTAVHFGISPDDSGEIEMVPVVYARSPKNSPNS